MGSISEAFLNFFHIHRNKSADDRANYIFYKIVDSVFENQEEYYKIQCINTKALFHAKIDSIVFDIEILHSLHPVQACYIGIEYAKYLKNNDASVKAQNNKKQELNKCSVCRYGNYNLQFQDRKGKIYFIHKRSKEAFLMDPRDVALSKELIEEFDAAQAFYIGLLAGLKLNNPTTKLKNTSDILKKSHLRLVK